jgi:hypothetical protein
MPKATTPAEPVKSQRQKSNHAEKRKLKATQIAVPVNSQRKQ